MHAVKVRTTGAILPLLEAIVALGSSEDLGKDSLS